MELSTLLSVEQVGAATEVFLVDKDVGDRTLAGLVEEVSLSKNSVRISIAFLSFFLSRPRSISRFDLHYGDW